MGCDIHMYVEEEVDGKWVFGSSEVGYEDQIYSGRDYELFGILAGVRRDLLQFELRGFPIDASIQLKEYWDEAKYCIHTPNYITKNELVEFIKNPPNIEVFGMMDKDQLNNLISSINSGQPDWDLLYPYCKMTNMGNHVSFNMTVPFGVSCGNSIEEIIDEIPENGRIVFFFDN